MSDALKNLMERIARLSDEQLLAMVDVDFTQYRPEALAYARAELRQRGIEPVRRVPEPERQPRAGTEAPPLRCLRCHSEMKYVGTKRLQDDARWGMFSQLGGLFKDQDYENLDAYVCSKCGRLELFVDGIGEDCRPQ
jgi:hypothetical protein